MAGPSEGVHGAASLSHSSRSCGEDTAPNNEYREASWVGWAFKVGLDATRRKQVKVMLVNG